MPEKGNMTRVELLNLVETWTNEACALLRSKGEDYAGEDVHANFKRIHAVCALYDIQPGERQEDVYLFLIILKLDRLIHNIHKPGAPNHESIGDTILDQTNYTYLMASQMSIGVED